MSLRRGLDPDSHTGDGHSGYISLPRCTPVLHHPLSRLSQNFNSGLRLFVASGVALDEHLAATMGNGVSRTCLVVLSTVSAISARSGPLLIEKILDTTCTYNSFTAPGWSVEEFLYSRDVVFKLTTTTTSEETHCSATSDEIETRAWVRCKDAKTSFQFDGADWMLAVNGTWVCTETELSP